MNIENPFSELVFSSLTVIWTADLEPADTGEGSQGGKAAQAK